MSLVQSNSTDLDHQARVLIEGIIDRINASRRQTVLATDQMSGTRDALLERRELSMAQIAAHLVPDLSIDTLLDLIGGEVKAFAGVSIQERFHNAQLLRPKRYMLAYLSGSNEYVAYMAYVNKHLPRIRDELIAYLEHKVDSLECLAGIRQRDIEIMTLTERIDRASQSVESAEKASAGLRLLAMHCHHCSSSDAMRQIIGRLEAALCDHETACAPAHALDSTDHLVRNWIDNLPRTLRDWGASS